MAYLTEGYPPNIKEMDSIQIKKFSIIENIMLLVDGKVDYDIELIRIDEEDLDLQIFFVNEFQGIAFYRKIEGYDCIAIPFKDLPQDLPIKEFEKDLTRWIDNFPYMEYDTFYYSLHQFLSNLYEYLGKYLASTKVEEDNKSLKVYHHQLGKLLTQIIRSKLETYWEKLWSIEKR